MTNYQRIQQKAIEEYFRNNCINYELISLIIDCSDSMQNEWTSLNVKHGLENVKYVLECSKEAFGMKTSITLFGSKLDVRPFKYGIDIDVRDYIEKQKGTRLYDAIVESCVNMMKECESLEYEYNFKGHIIIFTDGESDNSENYNLNDAKNIIHELKKKGICFYVADIKNLGLQGLTEDLGCEIIPVNDLNEMRRYMKFVGIRDYNQNCESLIRERNQNNFSNSFLNFSKKQQKYLKIAEKKEKISKMA